jgi:tetratricopeptide (TPR) repeat protein
MPRQRHVAVIAAGLVMLLIAGPGAPVRADQDDPRLDGLFQRLQHTPDAAEARVLEQQIWQVWLESDDAAINRLMEQGVLAMRVQDYGTALRTFDRMIEQAPEFAEGWNKRATAYFVLGDYRRSLADGDEVMKRNPYHWGALSGYGMIYMQLDQPTRALEYFEKALAVNPNLDQVAQTIEALRTLVLQRRRDMI